MTILKTPPHNDKADAAILAAVLLDNRVMTKVHARMEREDFFREKHRHIWDVMVDLHHAGKGDIDVITICDELSRRGLLDAIADRDERGKLIQGPNVLARLTQNLSHPGGVDGHMEVSRAYGRARKLLRMMPPLVEQAYHLSRPIDEIMEDINNVMSQCADTSQGSKYETFGDVYDAFMADYGLREDGKVEMGMLCGLPAIDALVGGWHTGRSTCVAGLSKMGKTKLAKFITMGIARRNNVVVDWYSAEMPSNDMMRRIVSYAGGITEDILRDPYKYRAFNDQAHQARVVEAGAVLYDLRDKVRFYKDAKPRLKDILLNVDARKAALKPGQKLMVVVDYIQRVDAGHTGQGAEYNNTTAASVELTGNAIEKDFCLLNVCHFNRTAANRKGIPLPSDARGSGAIEQDHDHFIVAHRPFLNKSGDEFTDARKFMLLWHCLNRHGEPGNAMLESDLGRNSFRRWDGDIPKFDRED